MKKLLLAIALVFMFSLVSAQFCESSLDSFKDARGNFLFSALRQAGIDPQKDISFTEPCECFGFQSTETAPWRDKHCAEGGQQLQERKITAITKPDCSITFIKRETRLIPREECRKCEDPVEISDFRLVRCVGGEGLFENEVIAENFTPNVDDCKREAFKDPEFRIEPLCQIPFVSNLVPIGVFIGDNLSLLGGAVAVILVIILIYLARR